MPADTRSDDRKRLLTLREYRALPEDDGYRDELVRGRLVREPQPGGRHGLLTTRLVRVLDEFVTGRGLGVVITTAGFLLEREPPTVRGPDVAVLLGAAAERLPARGYPQGAPTIAVEILSPSNRRADIAAKVADYHAAGSAEVWIVDPAKRTLRIERPGAPATLIDAHGELDGGALLPGLRLPIARLF